MKIIAQCPNCRFTAEVSPPCLLVELGEAEESDNSSVSWICQICNELVALPTELGTVIDLACAGASVLDSALADARPAYPESAAGGSVFTRDDLLDFHESLDDDAWIAAVLNPESP